MDVGWLFTMLCLVMVAAPVLLVAVLGMALLSGTSPPEDSVSVALRAACGAGLVAGLIALGLMLLTGERHVTLNLWNWVILPDEHFQYTASFLFDRLSIPFVILTFTLVGVIGTFASTYMHREPGYLRFHVFLSMFLLGMIVASASDTIEALFAGWELVGLSSALLVAFFQDRQQPVENGARVWITYRLADAAFLIAAVALHHLTGEGEFEGLMGSGAWPAGQATLTSGQALSVGTLLLMAVAGKSALVPLCGWMPRAMEGPTPSSAVFYGALSVHLGAFLLLRVSPILDLSPGLCVEVTAMGLSTAVVASLIARVQTDVKSALAYASLTQVGLIVTEIGLGFRYLPLVHIIGHASLRTLQFLRAPSLLHDYHLLEDAIGDRLPGGRGAQRSQWQRWRAWVYRFALERGYLDALLDDYVVRPVIEVFRQCDRWERRWTNWLAGVRPPERFAPPRSDERP